MRRLTKRTYAAQFILNFLKRGRRNHLLHSFLLLLLLLLLLFLCSLREKSVKEVISVAQIATDDDSDDNDRMMEVGWDDESHRQRLKILQGQNDPLPPKANGALIRCVVLSDTHGLHNELPALPQGDVLIHLGDVATRGSLNDIRSFVSYLRKQKSSFQDIVLLEGNHDRDLQRPDNIDLAKEYAGIGHFLRDENVVVANGRLSILGVSWSACKRDNYTLSLTEAYADRDFRNVDFFLSHKNSKRLSHYVQERRFPVHLFGHIHRGRGVRIRGETLMANCASIPAMRPTVIDWDPMLKQVDMVHAPLSI
jgi:predicted phosphodiesterase